MVCWKRAGPGHGALFLRMAGPDYSSGRLLASLCDVFTLSLTGGNTIVWKIWKCSKCTRGIWSAYVALRVRLSKGATLTLYLQDLISAQFSASQVYGAYAVGGMFCALSVLAAIVAVLLDIRFDAAHSAPVKWSQRPRRRSEAVYSELHDSPRNFWFRCIRNMLIDLRHFQIGYWVLVPICILGFPTITTFNGVMPALLSARWTAEGVPFTTDKINATMSILYTGAAALELVNGYIIDRVNRRGSFIVVALAILFVAHILFATTAWNAAPLVALAGVGFSFFGTSFWPSVLYFVPHNVLGSAYGAMCSFQNIGLASFPLVAAALEPPACGATFECVSLLFASLAAAGIPLAVWVYVLERRSARAAGDSGGGCTALIPDSVLNCCRRRSSGVPSVVFAPDSAKRLLSELSYEPSHTVPNLTLPAPDLHRWGGTDPFSPRA
jgi:hypothetical protein